jgi:excisionase family DNA binding protein
VLGALAMSAALAAPLTVKEVAALASVHEHTVPRAIREGHLEAFRRLGSTVYAIRRDAFERWAYASASRRRGPCGRSGIAATSPPTTSPPKASPRSSIAATAAGSLGSSVTRDYG